MFLSLFRGTPGSAALDNCVFLGVEEKNSLYEDGDVVIGGLFPLHYSPESSLPTYKTKPTPNISRALRWIQTMTFAIKEINQRSDLLPQLKLGYHIRDSCDDIPVALRALLLLVNGQPERGSGAENVNRNRAMERSFNSSNLGCAAVYRTVSPVIIGDVSYFASCSCLSDQREFPTFMRTMPSDAFQIRALARLVSYFGWTWVGVIGVESDYARFAIQLFLQESVQYGVCAAYTHFYPVTLSQQALDKLLNVIQVPLHSHGLRVSYNVYKAVYLVAHALQDMSDCKGGKGPFSNGTCADPKHFKPWQVRLLIHYLRRANFSALGEEVNFDQNGDPIAYYDLVNWQRSPDGSLHLVKVGFYDASSPAGYSLVINDSVIQWPASRSVCSDSCPPGSRVARRKGEPICCFDCVPCAEGEVSNETGVLCSVFYHPFSSCISLSILAIFFMYKDTPLVRANNMELSFLLLVFLAVCFLVGLLFIGEPSDWLCRIRYPAFGISVALCISCLLAKTAVVLMAFRSTLPGSNVMKWFGPNQQRASVFLGTAVQVIICLIWLLTSPPHANSNTDYHSATIIMECVTGSEVCFWCVLGYIGILACMCFLMAFLARKLPDNFNEAKFITFSMLIFFAVWITFIPVYVSTAGKYTVAVHIFAILASAFGLLFCIFAPKCYIIILKPEKNSKKHIMQSKL
uniref:G-protein coupled receptors family 3 profile domain-containing protein n=1 Tax=Lates calcarifer TaxID=8187 RepID=A0A4W6C961_LATCA